MRAGTKVPASEAPSLPAVGACCQFDGSAWLSMYVHLNCQLVCVRVCLSVCVCVCKWVTGHVVLCHNREDPVYSAKEMLPLLQSQFSCGSVHELSLIETTTAMI